MWKFLAALLLSALPLAARGQALITIGDSNVESGSDNGNANLVLAQAASLQQSGTIESLSFYVTTASGTLSLGVYDSTGPGGGPGNLLTTTGSFTPTTGWNTQNVPAVSVAPGNYWLAYLPSSANLSFRKQNSSGSCYLHAQTFSAGMPSVFPGSPSNCTPTTWSFYGTVWASGPVAVNGVCGSSNGAALSAAPTTNLCSSGTASAVTGSGPWAWSCAGSGGGTTASCSASVSTKFYSLQYTLTGLDLRSYPLFNVADSTPNGTPVYMATETFTVWLGQFPTLAACQAYVPPANPEFTITLSIPMPMSVTFISGSNMTATNNGCAQRTFQ